MKTTAQKQDELIEKFGQRFYNELGERTVMLQRLQGSKPRGLNSDALQLLNEVTEELYKEWIEDEWTCESCMERRTGPKNKVEERGLTFYDCDVCMAEKLLPQDTTGKTS